MAATPNKLSQFWHELKRRNVTRVLAVYIAVAFMLLELVDMISEPFGLPEWSMKIAFFILLVGLIITVVVSWIYDIRSERGIVKTKPTDTTTGKDIPKSSNGWKIAAYISIVIIIALIGFQIFKIDNRFGGNPNKLKSIAILPFENISGNPEQTYFADGITETLITELSRISALKVITIRNANKAAIVYDQPNSIDAFLEGSALLVGERVRVTARLIDQQTGELLWANQFDEELRDVFQLHSYLVNKISSEINILLTREEEKYLASQKKTDPEVYKLYLKGRYNMGKRTEQGLLNAIKYFEDAVTRDPQNAFAYSGLSDAYTLLCEYGLISSREAYPKALEAATKAIKINDRIAETHTSLAYIRLLFEWDWIGAEESFRKAIEINPDYATAHHWYSFFLILQNRAEESIREQKIALELDPLSLIINKGLGHRFLNARQYEKTIESLEQTLEIDSEFAPAYLEMGHAYLQLGDFEEAIHSFEKAKNISGGLVGLTAPTVGYGYAISNRITEARNILDQYNKIANERYVNPYLFACLHLGLNEIEDCFKWLNIAYHQKTPILVQLKVHPIWDPVRSDQRFIEIYNKIWPNDNDL